MPQETSANTLGQLAALVAGVTPNVQFVNQMATLIGRAMRADQRSMDSELSPASKAFHAGLREAYLQSIALLAGTQVKDIRMGVLGKGNPYPEFSDKYDS